MPQRGGSLDYAAFRSPSLDVAFTAAHTAATEAGRRQSWFSVEQLLIDSMPVVWVYHSRGVQGVSARLSGVHMDLRGELVAVHDWSLAPRGAAR